MQEINNPVLETLNTEKREESKTYFDYYNRVIDNYKVGFKLVLGGTGLGKTYGIEKVLEHYTKVAPEKKFIYSTYRINLLTQFKDKQQDKCVHLRGNEDIVKEVANKYFEDVKTLLNDNVILNIIENLPKSSVKNIANNIIETLQTIKVFEEITKEESKKIISKDIIKYISSFMNEMRDIVKNISKDDIPTYHAFLTKHTIIERIFPYIEFERKPEKQILLVTIHKLFDGFFDGKKNVNITKIKDKIIFLDEFDFLEEDILKKICEDIEIEDPFNFVRQFHTEMKLRLAKKEYLTRSPKEEKLRKNVEDIMDTINTLKKDEREGKSPINYPDFYWFTCQEKALLHKNIFQSNYTVVDSPIFLKETERSFELTSQKTGTILPAFDLMNVACRCTKQIVRFFGDLQNHSPAIHQEIVEQVYGKTDYVKILREIKFSRSFEKEASFRKNTNWEKIYDEGFGIFQIRNLQHATENLQSVNLSYFGIQDTPEGVLVELIRNNLVFGLSATADLDRVVNTFDMEWIRNKCADLRFKKEKKQEVNKAFKDLFEIYKDDNEQIKDFIKSLILPTLKENPNLIIDYFTKWCVQKYSDYVKGKARELKSDTTIIRSIIAKRTELTYFIPQEVQPFYIDLLPEDSTDIAIMNKEKWQKRESHGKIIFDIATPFCKEDNEDLFQILKAIFTHYESSHFATKDFQKDKVFHFLGILDYIIKNPLPVEAKEDTHLAFFDSFKQIKLLLELETKSKDIYDELKRHFVVSKEKKNFHYEVNYNGKDFILILLNSDLSKFLDMNQNAKQQYEELFWREPSVPVIIITQYASASNGINLTYFPNKEAKTQKQDIDFRTIHLIDAPHYYFDEINNNETAKEKKIKVKKDVWKLAKLSHRKAISKQHFDLFLADSKYLNNFYKKNTKDFQLNQIAKFIQALGRIERVRRKMGHQRIRFSTDVYKIFETFLVGKKENGLYQDIYKKEREDRELYTSPLIREVYEHIKHLTGIKNRKEDEKKVENLKAKDDLNRSKLENDFIQKDNSSMKLFRQNGETTYRLPYLNKQYGTIQGSYACLVNEVWKKIRESALRLDTECPILTHFGCIVEYEKGYLKEGVIYKHENMDYLPEHEGKTAQGFERWDFNRCYEVIGQNEIIQKHFNRKGYELAFKDHNNHKYFTPYFYQAFLLGALGEECAEAILQANGIKLVDDLKLPHYYFEKIDKQIEGNKELFIDVKNFSNQTIERLNLDDAKFRETAKNKIDYLRQYEKKAKIIYMVVESDAENKGNIAYFDLNFSPKASFEAADIIIVQGIIDRNRPNEYCKGFETFISDINHYKK